MSKRNGFISIIDYIQRQDHQGKTISRNIFSSDSDIKSIKEEFIKNSSFVPKRKNGVYLYHEIISLPPLTYNKEETQKILTDLAEHYLEKRAPDCLSFCKIHLNTNNPHIHIVISSNPRRTRHKHRLSKSDFARIKKELEQYKRLTYPDLMQMEHEAPREVKRKRGAGRTRNEQERQRRTKGTEPSQKETVLQKLDEALSSAKSEKGFLSHLGAYGLEMYTRGRTQGVIDTHTGRKYRLKTLGVLEEFKAMLKGWQRDRQRTKALESTLIEKGKRLWNRLGFRKELKSMIGDKNHKVNFKHRKIRSRSI